MTAYLVKQQRFILQALSQQIKPSKYSSCWWENFPCTHKMCWSLVVFYYSNNTSAKVTLKTFGASHLCAKVQILRYFWHSSLTFQILYLSSYFSNNFSLLHPIFLNKYLHFIYLTCMPTMQNEFNIPARIWFVQSILWAGDNLTFLLPAVIPRGDFRGMADGAGTLRGGPAYKTTTDCFKLTFWGVFQ